MIDTVILRVHDLKRNNALVNNLDNYTARGYETKYASVDIEDLKKIHDKGIRKPAIILEELRFKNAMTGAPRFILRTKVGKHVNLSSHYMLTYFINYSRDFIEFNFSIPKYTYGTNVFLFIRHQMDRGYAFHSATDIEFNIKECYDLLLAFLKRFFFWEFMWSIDLTDVEVNRIDACYNQVFRSKEEALLYLEYQKRLKKKYARDEEGVMRGYETSLMYKTDRYSAKIYHKGSEYEKHDKKEHLKYNEKHKSHHFKTEKLQAFADCILRYELTIRNKFLNYLHKRYIFRKKDKLWQKMYDHYNLVETINQRNTRLAKKIGTIKDLEKKIQHFEKHPYIDIKHEAKVAHRGVAKIIARQRFFKLEISPRSYLFNNVCTPFNDDDALFSRELLRLCLKNLIQFVGEFQIKQLPPEEVVRNMIRDYNRNRRSGRLPENEMMNFYSHLLKHGSFKDVAKFCNYSRATLYRYIERFKLIGITEKHITPAEKNFGIPEIPKDLRRYHSHINEHNLLKGIKITEASAI